MDTSISEPSTGPDRTPRRVRHDLRFRIITVKTVASLTSGMTRVVFGGDELDGFVSPGFDDHIKLFLPAAGQSQLARPSFGPGGLVFEDGEPRPVMRDYTPRAFDADSRTLTIDFALHDNGPATDWARLAKEGDCVAIGGPRGSFILPMGFDWHLLVGDETAFPAIARRLSELPAGSKVVVVAETDGPQGELPFETEAEASVVWVHRHGTGEGAPTSLLEALKILDFPAGDYHAWVACESLSAKAIREHLVTERAANPKWVRASGYWRKGAPGAHDSYDD